MQQVCPSTSHFCMSPNGACGHPDTRCNKLMSRTQSTSCTSQQFFRREPRQAAAACGTHPASMRTASTSTPRLCRPSKKSFISTGRYRCVHKVRAEYFSNSSPYGHTAQNTPIHYRAVLQACPHKQEAWVAFSQPPQCVLTRGSNGKLLHLVLAVQHHRIEVVVRKCERHGCSCQHGAARRAEGPLLQPAGLVAAWRAVLPRGTGSWHQLMTNTCVA